MNIKLMRSAATVGLLAVATSASAVERSYPLPPSAGFADMESATNIQFSGWDDDTRYFRFKITSEPCPTNEIQVALGTDADHDGDLAPEETAVRFGIDCGEPFVCDERLVRVQSSSSRAEDSASIVNLNLQAQPATTTFDLSRIWSRDWNLAKITSRGATFAVPGATDDLHGATDNSHGATDDLHGAMEPVHGAMEAVAEIIAEFKNNPMRIILK